MHIDTTQYCQQWGFKRVQKENVDCFEPTFTKCG